MYRRCHDKLSNAKNNYFLNFETWVREIEQFPAISETDYGYDTNVTICWSIKRQNNETLVING